MHTHLSSSCHWFWRHFKKKNTTSILVALFWPKKPWFSIILLLGQPLWCHLSGKTLSRCSCPGKNLKLSKRYLEKKKLLKSQSKGQSQRVVGTLLSRNKKSPGLFMVKPEEEFIHWYSFDLGNSSRWSRWMTLLVHSMQVATLSIFL